LYLKKEIEKIINEKGLDQSILKNKDLKVIIDELSNSYDKLKNSHDDMAFIARAVMELNHLSSTEAINDFVAQKIYELIDEEGIVTVVEFNHETNEWSMSSFKGLNKNLQKITQLIGADIENMKGKVKGKYYNNISEGKLTPLVFDFDNLTNGLISDTTGKELIKLLSLKDIHSIAFKNEDYLYGNVTIIRTNTSKPLKKELIENLIFQVSQFLEKENAIKALKENEEKYRSIFNNAALGIFRTTPEGKFLDMNEALAHMLGYSSAEEAIENITDIEDIYVDTKRRDLIKKQLEKKSSVLHFENTYKRKNGDHFTVNLYIRAQKDKNGRTRFFEGMAEEITEQKKVEETIRRQNKQLFEEKERAEESDRLKSAFLANMTHELRTPLNAIMGYSDLLQNEANLSKDDSQKFVKRINDSGYLLLEIIESIFDISSLESGEADIHLTEFEMSRLIFELNKITEIEQKRYEKENLRLILPQNHPTEFLKTDRTKIKQVLINFLRNALKFTEKGFVMYGYEIEDDDITFFVKDSGIGIPKNKQDIIFNYFRQGDEGYNRKYGGIGIGLTISSKISQLLNAKIWLDSEPGQGSTFYLKLAGIVIGKKEDVYLQK